VDELRQKLNQTFFPRRGLHATELLGEPAKGLAAMSFTPTGNLMAEISAGVEEKAGERWF
jgi:hypothetical protein